VIGRWIDWCARNRFLVFMGTLLLVLAVALATGLSLYYKNLNFGSMEDYLLLFLWAAGLDQSKKLITG